MEFNQSNSADPRAAMKVLAIIHLALLAGQTMFAIVTVVLAKNAKFDFSGTDGPYLYVVPVMAVVCFAVSAYLFKQQIEEAKKATTLHGKIIRYQTAMIVSLALLEGASLIGIVSFLITANYVYLLVAVLIILFFISRRPTAEKIGDDMELSYEERAELK